ncbi:hypothetical protein [Ruegeria sp. SCP11]
MLSIFARSFMVATHMDGRDKYQDRQSRDEDQWWKKTKRVSRSYSK